MTRTKPAQIWPCSTFTYRGVKHFRLPFPTGKDLSVQVADGDEKFLSRLAQSCVRERAKTWARRAFPEAFAGL